MPGERRRGDDPAEHRSTVPVTPLPQALALLAVGVLRAAALLVLLAPPAALAWWWLR